MDSTDPDAAPPEAPEATQDAVDGGSDSQPVEAPAWFREYADRTERDRRALNKELEKLRRRVAGKDEPPAQGDPAGPGAQHTPAEDSRAEIMAAARWGQVSAKLTAGARAELENQLSEGRSFSEVVQMAEMLARFGAKGSAPQAEPPKGEARPGSRTSQSASYPGSYAEWQQLALDARKGKPEAVTRYNQLMNDPDFIEKFGSLR